MATLSIGDITDRMVCPMDGYRANEKKRRRNSSVRTERKALSGNLCACCGFYTRIEVHHIQPLIFDGEDELWNTTGLCSLCHKYAPNEGHKFVGYQKIGGQMALHVLHTLSMVINDERKRPGAPSQMLPKLRNLKDELECAIASDDFETIEKHVREHLMRPYGVIPLEHCVGEAIKDGNVEKWRQSNMALLSKQSRVINGYTRRLHPCLPKPPAALHPEYWDREDILNRWHDEWDRAANSVYTAWHQEKSISFDAYKQYDNAWLASESMIDFLDLKDIAFLKSVGADCHPDCLLERNRIPSKLSPMEKPEQLALAA